MSRRLRKRGDKRERYTAEPSPELMQALETLLPKERDTEELDDLYRRRAAPAAVAEPAEPQMTLTKAAKDVLAERRRQTEAEGFDTAHDDEHAAGELADAAACYALGVYSERGDAGVPGDIPPYWPWDESWWRPKDRRRNLVRAAALLLAEIDRLDRADGRASRWAAAEPWIA